MSGLEEDGRRLLAQACFSVSVPRVRLLPADEGLEVAFAGRSNSGKSSAINLLCGQKNLARTSRTPGRTQHLVVFDLAPARRLVDLPGFGYAKVSKQMRAHWDHELPSYLEQRQSLCGLVLLIDIRHLLKPNDEMLIEWCHRAQVPLHILLNKSDKLSRGAAKSALLTLQRYLEEARFNQATAQLFSALKRTGQAQAWSKLAEWMPQNEGSLGEE